MILTNKPLHSTESELTKDFIQLLSNISKMDGELWDMSINLKDLQQTRKWMATKGSDRTLVSLMMTQLTNMEESISEVKAVLKDQLL